MTEKTPGGPPEIEGLRYLEPLAQGGYSEVFLYEQDMPRMPVAVKVLTDASLGEEAIRRFTDEANTMAALGDHPYIVQIFRASVATDGRPYLVMRYYPKPNLAVRARREQLSVAEVLQIGIRIASAIETAHRASILHRDVKPANVLSDNYNSPGLTDFGIAATKVDGDDSDPAGMSIPWAPPEILYATSPADERSDIYSFSATLWQLLVGRPPFEIPGGDNSAAATMRRIRESAPPSTGRDDVPASLERLLQQGMAKSPGGRPATVLALARALQQIEQELDLSVTKIDVPDNVVESVRERGAASDESATRLRAAHRVEAQPVTAPVLPTVVTPVAAVAPVAAPPAASAVPPMPPAPMAPASMPPVPLPAAVPGPTRHRASSVAAQPPPLEHTTRRETSAPAPETVAVPAPPRARGRRGVVSAVAIGAVVVVGLAVGIAVATQGGGHADQDASDAGTATPTTTSAADDALGSGSVPGQPQVKGVATGNAANFSWTYANAVPTDSFRIDVLSPTPASHASKVASYKAVTGGQTMCITVTVVRMDGATQSIASNPVCTS